MTPQELADSIHDLVLELTNTHNVLGILIGDVRKLEDLARNVALASAPPVPGPNPHWLEYPLDRMANVSGEFGTHWTIGGKDWTHEGIDFAIAEGHAVRTCASGKVVIAGVRSGYGNCVRIEHEHDGEKWWTWYAHLSIISVMLETRVLAEQLIGLSGNTGNTTGPHLHLTVQRETCKYLPPGCNEILRGVVNPRDFVDIPAQMKSTKPLGGWYAPR